MRRRGSESPQILHADVTSLISKLAVQEGAIVAAGNPLIEMVAQNRLEARLGVEPEDSNKVKPGQKVSLARVNAPGTKSIVGRIRKISRAADPTTRLVQVFTELPSTAKFLLGEYVSGKIPISSAEGLIVPRSAVLPEEDHYILFTVKDGRAREHTVRVDLENDKEVEVIATDLHPGEPVVILGNYDLKTAWPSMWTNLDEFYRLGTRTSFSLLFLIAALIVGGFAATSKLPVALFPYVSFPRVVVSLDAGDRPAERMMIEVTFPIEQAVRAVPGVRDVRSTTSRGSAEISINFDWGEDMVAAHVASRVSHQPSHAQLCLKARLLTRDEWIRPCFRCLLTV